MNRSLVLTASSWVGMAFAAVFLVACSSSDFAHRCD